MSCQHPYFKHDIKLKWFVSKELKLRQLVGYLKLTCTQCNLLYSFAGPEGFSTHCPSVSPGGTELRIPLEPPAVEELMVDEEEEVPNDKEAEPEVH